MANIDGIVVPPRDSWFHRVPTCPNQLISGPHGIPIFGVIDDEDFTNLVWHYETPAELSEHDAFFGRVDAKICVNAVAGQRAKNSGRWSPAQNIEFISFAIRYFRIISRSRMFASSDTRSKTEIPLIWVSLIWSSSAAHQASVKFHGNATDADSKFGSHASMRFVTIQNAVYDLQQKPTNLSILIKFNVLQSSVRLQF